MEDNLPVVSILMGSDSDLELCKDVMETLDKFGVSYEVRVISAHRDTESCVNYAKTAKERGIKVIIAAAGMSAHLAGVVSANTLLPVIGIPLCRTSLLGLDALFSIIEMPPGIPVAAVGIDSSANAAFVAMRILALLDKDLSDKLTLYSKKMKTELKERQKKLDWRLKGGN
jgi:phosphoribosylaminoimidazole carboxylase PurE protein